MLLIMCGFNKIQGSENESKTGVFILKMKASMTEIRTLQGQKARRTNRDTRYADKPEWDDKI